MRTLVCTAAFSAAILLAGCTAETSADFAGPAYDTDTLEAKAPKVDICHLTGNGSYHIINVSQNSQQAHMNHGDALPADLYLDVDGDGFGDPATGIVDGCPDDGDVTNGDDCDDANDEVNPDGVEVCEDGLDNDCDGVDDTCVDLSDCGGQATGNFDGSDYLFCQGQKTVPQSEAFCASAGMSLAYVDGFPENDYLVDTALAAYGYVNFELTSYWIANTKTDSPILPWAAGEPNSSADQCIHLLRFIGQPYSWNDAGCTDWTWGWICEAPE